MRRRVLALAAALVCVSVVAAVLVFLHSHGDGRATRSGRCLKGFIGPYGHGCWMLGDVDGDGHDDAFAVVHRRLANGKDRIFLVVKTGSETLRSWIGDIEGYYDGANVAAIAQIDDKAGAELIVQDWAGAFEAGYTIYTVRRGRLIRIRTLWDYIQVGGTVGTGQDSVNCPYGPSKGVLLVGYSSLYALKGRVEIRRELWRLKGTRFVLVRSLDRTYSRKELGPDAVAPKRVPGFPVLKSWDFAGCGTYPGDKVL